ncbi:MAG: MAPEG family protein [Xanthomonadales bacterium]|nr:MAPEG family protein [Xanthomonadales bacterium]
MTTTALALLGYITWMVILLAILAGLRTSLTLSGQRRANDFSPSGEDVSPFSHRLCRTHANCYEHFPIFGGLMLLALATATTQVTDGLALVLLAARVAQGLVHLWSTRNLAVLIRFHLFLVQYLIAIYWLYRFFRAWLGS